MMIRCGPDAGRAGTSASTHAWLAAVLVLAGGCRGEDPTTSRLLKVLQSCDYGPSCAKALAEAQALPAQVAATPNGLEVRRVAFHIGLKGAASFPPMDRSSFPVPSAEDLVREAEAIGETGARGIASLLAHPTCEAFRDSLMLVDKGGLVSQSAIMACMQVLAQILAAVTPDHASVFARSALHLVGCTMSDRTSPAAALVQTRNLLHDLVDRCERMATSDHAVQSTCGAVKDLLTERSLPLPWPDASAGDLLFTSPPVSLRGTGLALTPPFALVLAAGRLGVFDQPVLAPGIRASPETRVDWVLDLRTRHVPDDVVLALKEVIEKRKPVVFEQVQAVFFVVDRATPASELFEVLHGLIAVSDAVAVVATTVPGRPDPVFLPVNFWISERILMNPLGQARAFGREAPLVVRLRPFQAEVSLRDRTEVVEIAGGGTADLRPLYQTVRSLIGDGPAPSVRVISDGPVPVGLLTSVIEVVSFRVPDAATASSGAFRSATPSREPDSRPATLCRVVVVEPAEMPHQ